MKGMCQNRHIPFLSKHLTLLGKLVDCFKKILDCFDENGYPFYEQNKL